MIPRILHVPNDDELGVMIREGAIAKMGVNAFGVFCYLCTKQFFDEPVSMSGLMEQLGVDEKTAHEALIRLINLDYAR
jgi:hypothetical protein